ncbi:hypothetical protein CCACVL1_28551 [Corchorus capsularis]|uniref:Uncharacterized protein n=1 Tax=Corchorus capsularis TaxID=210143 RepID=A0A1R3G6C3_COCAP|nr:hypothetical protein CCACVL1_28551 [Corchorus capsularis]
MDLTYEKELSSSFGQGRRKTHKSTDR